MCLESTESMIYAARMTRVAKLANMANGGKATKLAKPAKWPWLSSLQRSPRRQVRNRTHRNDERIPRMNIKPGSIAKGACTAIGACVIGAAAAGFGLFLFSAIELPRIERHRHV